MQVRDVMTQNVISVAANETILKAARLCYRTAISGLPVVDAQGVLVGMVTEGIFSDATNSAPSGGGRNGSNSCSDPDGSPKNMSTPPAERSKTS